MQDGTLLVGDAGGTNVRFALAAFKGGRVNLSEIWKRPGKDFDTFEMALDAYLKETSPDYIGASFGFAGVTGGSHVELLNRGWTVDLAAVKQRLGVDRLVAINDFIAMARSAPELTGEQLRLICAGKPDPNASLAIGGPGTGFGVGLLRRIEPGWVVIGGEGGHQAFTPETDIEWKLAEKLRKKLGYVSNEIVTAGMGFDDTRDALFEIMGLKHKPLTQAEVIDAAHAGDPLALEFCRLRARAVMTAMGNMALVANAAGGVFIAGGVSQRLEPWLKERAALDRFYKRGVRTGLMKPMPLNLIASEAAPLIGSAHLWRDEQMRGWL
ncbi:MAG: glucokinase [Hyphomonadaceae bacterium]|nr:glucokinase [Hyphomonadaceae bacterium]